MSLLFLVAITLAACGSSSSTDNSTAPASSKSTTATSQSTAPKSTTTTTISVADFQAKWCSLSKGDPQAKAIEVLGQPNSPETVSASLAYLHSSGFDLPAGMTADGWASGSGRYLVTYENGTISDLQAYEGLNNWTQGAAGLPCAPFAR